MAEVIIGICYLLAPSCLLYAIECTLTINVYNETEMLFKHDNLHSAGFDPQGCLRVFLKALTSGVIRSSCFRFPLRLIV